ncbi:MAG TPA: PepSY-like domain-containing protein [Mucilaginibacter sp.]|nr:PepSY-like domain-containing protein [Mucilaginibacter sp.]
MKSLRSYKMYFIALTMFYTNHILAQSTNDVPSIVSTAFATKYPKAEVKKWNVVNHEYIAKAKEGRHKYNATFDQKGNWIMTATKINWPWKLPAVVKASFKKCKYKNWNMYSVKLIDKPTGQFYQILVDDRNHPVDIFHQNLVTENRLVEIKSNGELVKERGTDENAAL